MIPQRMSKFFRLLVGIVTLAALFSGCGPAKTTTGSQTQEKTTVQPIAASIQGAAGSTSAGDKVSFEPPSYRTEYATDNSSKTLDASDGKGGIGSDSSDSRSTGNIVSSSNTAATGTSNTSVNGAFTTYSTTTSTDPVFHGVVNGQYAGANVFHGVVGGQFRGVTTQCPNPDIYTPSSCGVATVYQADPVFQGVVR